MTDAREYVDAGVENGRQPAIGTNGMVSTPHPFATLVGLDVLRSGGNAVDAALAVSAALMVAAPHECGLGGDAWWAIAVPGQQPVVLNASGESGSRANADALRQQGHASIPLRGPWSVTVPGAVAGWIEAHRGFATRDLGSLLEPAIRAARNGLAITPHMARRLIANDDLLAARPDVAAIYRPNGRPLEVGERLVLADVASTLDELAREPRGIYDGELAARIVRASEEAGGWLTKGDLAEATASRVEAASADFAGWTIWQAPPNSQGIVALVALGVVERLGIASKIDTDATPARTHAWIEAARLSMAVRDLTIGDPREMRISAAELLEANVLDRLAGLVSRTALPEPSLRSAVAELIRRPSAAQQPQSGTLAGRPVAPAPGGDTVHFAVVGEDGTAVSCIQSLFVNFGSGIAVPGTGIVLQNRGSSFSLEPGHPNELRPRRRPLHTLMPGLATAAGEVVAAFGSMGGHAQSQLHLQMIDGLALQRLDPATVTDRPRWFAGVDESGEEDVLLEARSDFAEALRGLGHRVRGAGRYDEQLGHEQIVTRDPASGVLVGAADPRTDGLALGF